MRKDHFDFEVLKESFHDRIVQTNNQLGFLASQHAVNLQQMIEAYENLQVTVEKQKEVIEGQAKSLGEKHKIIGELEEKLEYYLEREYHQWFSLNPELDSFKFPPQNQIVLVYCPEMKNQYAGVYTGTKWEYGVQSSEFSNKKIPLIKETVTHWKHLPENPETEEENYESTTFSF